MLILKSTNRRKKASVAHIIFIHALKRWTKISKIQLKKFLIALDTKNALYKHVDLFTDTKKEYGTYFINSERKVKLNSNLKKKYLKIKNIKTKIFSKLPGQFFLPPSKYRKPIKTKTIKQIWLNHTYTWFKKKISTNKNLQHDFLTSFLGQQFLTAYLFSQNTINNRDFLSRKKNKFLGVSAKVIRSKTFAKYFRTRHKFGWFYDNLILTKNLPYRFINSVKKYPYNLFYSYWKQHKRSPWLDYLESKRRVYIGFLTRQNREQKWTQRFIWIPYLRKRKPMYQKKNKLYAWRHKLLFKFWTRNRIPKRKKARIKQVLAKTILPFFGHLKMKQFLRLKKKAQKKNQKVYQESQYN